MQGHNATGRYHASTGCGPTHLLCQLVPNILTLSALGAGMTAITLAISSRYEASVIAIIVAGVFDGLDGRAARVLNSTSAFGAELDSLSDIVCFGVAPGVVLYIWTMAQMAIFGWLVIIGYAACCGLRLARFNIQRGVEAPAYVQRFFTGVPAPAGAGLVLMPMFMSFAWGASAFRSPVLNAIVIVAVALLMVSRLPTLSLKAVHLPHNHFVPVIIAIIAAALLAAAPWSTLIVAGSLYIMTIPATIVAFNRLRHEATSHSEADPRPAQESTKEAV